MTGEPQKIVGRDAELASIAGFLDKIATGPVACVIEGDAGIGKTTLWSAGIMVARARGFRILSARPLEPDSRLSYAGLGDLLDGVVEDVLSSLPEPQRKALSVALLLQEPDDRPADPRAVSVAALEGLRTTARQHPTLLAID